jgi:glycosyltransferase involved in cell wall biosynthesis
VTATLRRRAGAGLRLLREGDWVALARIVYARYCAVALGFLLTLWRRPRLARIVAAFPPGPIFIIKSTVDWTYPYRQRPQHMTQALTEIGVNCLYVSPRFGFDRFILDRAVNRRLVVCDKLAWVLNRVEAPVVYLLSTDNTLDQHTIDQFLTRPGARVIYDYIDEIDAAVSRDAIPESHLRAHESALRDERLYCLASARSLLKEVEERRGRRFALVTNGVDMKRFRVSRDLSSVKGDFRRICQTGRPIIGYYGALASWVDYELIERLARARSQYEFVLIGPDYDGSCKSLSRMTIPNLDIIPPVPYEELPCYATWFDVCFIPFLLNDITHSTSPLKLFEYMALGRPIVSTAIQEAKYYESVMIGDTPKTFGDMIDSSLALDVGSLYWRQLSEDAQSNSWNAKARDVAHCVGLTTDA